jgi:hypothetical protein
VSLLAVDTTLCSGGTSRVAAQGHVHEVGQSRLIEVEHAVKLRPPFYLKARAARVPKEHPSPTPRTSMRT